MDVVEKDLEDLGAPKWRKIVQVREKWSDLVVTVKTIGEYEGKKKKKNISILILNSKIFISGE